MATSSAVAPADVLSQLRSSCSRLSRVHFKAQSVTTVPHSDSTGRHQIGQFEYWADGGRYRIDSRFEGRVKEDVIDWSIAYDGNRYQSLNKSVSMLNYGKNRVNSNVAVPHNPLFSPWAFLLSKDELERYVHLDLVDLDDDVRWQSILDGARVVANKGAMEVTVEIRSVQPNGTGDGEGVVTLTLCRQEGFGYLPTTIEFPADQKGVTTRVVVDEYQSVAAEQGLLQLPKTTHVFAIRDGAVLASQEFKIEALDLDATVPPGIFTIDASKANIVWDEDVGVFVKTLGGFRPQSDSLATYLMPDETSVKPAGASGQLPDQGVATDGGGGVVAQPIAGLQTLVQPKKVSKGATGRWCLAAICLVSAGAALYVFTRMRRGPVAQK